MSATCETSQLPRGWLKLAAPDNMAYMSVTCETSHVPIGWLNWPASKNMCDMSVTADVSQSATAPLNPDRSNRCDVLVTPVGMVSTRTSSLVSAKANARLVVPVGPHSSTEVSDSGKSRKLLDPSRVKLPTTVTWWVDPASV